jgi:hypothetical protein
MHIKIIIASIFAACALHAAPLPIQTPISTLPVVITKPGYYYFVGPLIFQVPTPASPTTAITVNAAGPVVIDMRGFTVTGPTRVDFPTDGYFTVYPTGILIQSSNVTVLNGEISGFWNGISALGTATAYLTGLDLERITFYQSDSDGTGFSYVNNSIVRNCTYIENYAGAEDGFSQTGNTYINDKSQGSSNPQWSFVIVPQFPYKVVYSYTVIPVPPQSNP